MNDISALLDHFNIKEFIFMLFILLFGLQSAFKSTDWILTRLGIETRWSLRQKHDSVMLKAHDKDLGTINQELRGVHDKINVLGQMLTEMQSKADASERAKLKDRISQGYRIYHDRKTWTEMEKESFEGLIRDYERHGGENSFVHSICEPESCTWKIVKDN